MKRIAFPDDMIRAILARRKTQTRHSGVCPYGMPGDALVVTEAYCLEREVDGNAPPHVDGRPIQRTPDAVPSDGEALWVQPHYRATDPEPELAYEYGPKSCRQCQDGDPHAHWKSARSMPAWASRITLRIVDVRVEPVQAITPQDILAEGIRIPINAATGNPLLDISSPYAPAHYLSPEQARHFDEPAWLRAYFASQWDVLHAKRGHTWASNPLVWVTTFEVAP